MLGLLDSAALIGEVKDLCEDDVRRYEQTGGTNGQVRDFRAVRDKHHRIAQLFALGTTPTEIAARMDMAVATISTLRRSPAMEALVEQYRKEAFSADLGVTGMIEEAAIDSLRELHARIACGDMEDKELVKATMDLLDRTGRGPTKKVERRDVRLTGSELLALKAQAREAEGGFPARGAPIFDVTPHARRDSGSAEGPSLREENREGPGKDLSGLPDSRWPVD